MIYKCCQITPKISISSHSRRHVKDHQFSNKFLTQFRIITKNMNVKQEFPNRLCLHPTKSKINHIVLIIFLRIFC